MTTNKKKTFAERARDIKNKYKRAEFDALEQKDMEAELESLMAEQEAVREAMGLNEQPQQVQQFGTGGSPEDPEVVQRNNEPQYPEWVPDWAVKGIEGFNWINTLGNSLGNDGNLITGVAPVPGRGFKGGYKNLVQNMPRNIPKQTFSRAPLTKSTFTPTPKVEGDLSQVMDELVNAPGGLSKQFPRSATSTVMDELVNAPGGLSKQFPQGATRLGYKAPAGKVSGVNMSGSPVNPTVSSGQSNFNIPWGNIGYSATGVGGAGLLGLGIYGLTQLPDGRVVDKQGKEVPPQVVQQIANTPVDATSGVNIPIANTPVSKQTDNNIARIDSKGNVIDKYGNINNANYYSISPYKYGNGVGPIINPKYAPDTLRNLLTEQKIQSEVKNNNNSGSTVIKQPLVTSEFMTPEQAALGIERDIRNSNTFSPEALNFHPKQPLNTALELDKLNTYAANQKSKYDDLNKPSFWDKNKQNLPYAISGLSNIASNLILANMAKKIPQVQPVMATPQKINLEPKANILRQQADVSKNVNMMNARNLGLNPGATLGSMGVINSGVDRGLSDALTNLYLGQEQANVGTANQFALQNQEAANRANLYNSGMKYQGLQDRLGYLGAALGTIPGVMKDIRADKADKATRDMYSAYYKSMGRNYMNEGDIWDNPEDGFRYVVRNNKLVKSNKIK